MHTFYEKKLSSATLYEGRVFTITKDEVELENGKTACREVVHHSGGAGVLALSDKGEAALVRQYRYGAGEEQIEIPAGKMEPGEPAMETARRELREEAGLLAKNLEPFGSVLPTCAYCTEVIYLFLATDLENTAQALDTDEFLEVFWLPLEEAVRLVLAGQITDAKTVSALLRAKILLEQGELAL